LSARAQRKPVTAPRKEEHHGARQGAGPRGAEGGQQRHDNTHWQRCHVHLQCLLDELPSLLFLLDHPQAFSAASAEAVYHVASRICLTRVCARMSIIHRAQYISCAHLKASSAASAEVKALLYHVETSILLTRVYMCMSIIVSFISLYYSFHGIIHLTFVVGAAPLDRVRCTDLG